MRGFKARRPSRVRAFFGSRNSLNKLVSQQYERADSLAGWCLLNTQTFDPELQDLVVVVVDEARIAPRRTIRLDREPRARKFLEKTGCRNKKCACIRNYAAYGRPVIDISDRKQAKS
jgi:hypothetical protein